MSKPYQFHAAEISYFSAKVRPALRYKQLHYEELRPDISKVRELTGLAFIPIVVTPDGEPWQDSSDILDQLEALYPEPPLQPTTPLQRMACLLIELYVDEFGVIPAMNTRWGTPERVDWARARFGAQFGNPSLGNMAAEAMMKRRDQIGVSPESAPALEAHLVDLLDATSAHFEAHPYLLGSRMSLADCSLMGPLHGHYFTDLESRMQLLRTAVMTVAWIDRCNIPNTDEQGEWLADDALAPTLLEVLGVMGRDAAPTILDCIANVEAWMDANPKHEGPLPRGVGGTTTHLRDRTLSRSTIPYSLWMLQRTLDAYADLSGAERTRVDAALAGSGWEALLAHRPRHRVTKQRFDVVYA